MKIDQWFGKFELERVKLGPSWANAEIPFDLVDQDAAWDLYVEMLTRIVTQPLRTQATRRPPFAWYMLGR